MDSASGCADERMIKRQRGHPGTGGGPHRLVKSSKPAMWVSILRTEETVEKEEWCCKNNGGRERKGMWRWEVRWNDETDGNVE